MKSLWSKRVRQHIIFSNINTNITFLSIGLYRRGELQTLVLLGLPIPTITMRIGKCMHTFNDFLVNLNKCSTLQKVKSIETLVAFLGF